VCVYVCARVTESERQREKVRGSAFMRERKCEKEKSHFVSTFCLGRLMIKDQAENIGSGGAGHLRKFENAFVRKKRLLGLFFNTAELFLKPYHGE